ncbi:MAG: HTTM domain-containing protein [Acidimicrobiales bacterium]
MKLGDRLDKMIDALGDIRHMSVLRIVLGPIVLLHLQDYFADARDGIVYSDRFYLPYFDWYPEAGPASYEVMLWAAGISAVAMSVGLATRVTTAYTAFFVGYNIFLSKTHFAHNRAFLLILLITVALLPVGRHYSIDNRIRRARGVETTKSALLWPIWLVRFEVVVVYCASALSKVIDQDWWSGTVLRLRAVDNRQLALDEGAPAWILDILANDTFQWWFSKSAVLGEFAIGLGFIHRRTRLFALWLAIPFHLAIQIGARVQVFSWAAIAALVIWVTPAARGRTVIVGSESRLRYVVAYLDWFGRFETVEGPAGSLMLIDSDGTERLGKDALWTTLSRLPALFFFAGPVVAYFRLRARLQPDHPAPGASPPAAATGPSSPTSSPHS